MEKPDPLKQLEEEIKAIKPEDHPVCPGCGEKHPPDDSGITGLKGVNVLDVANNAGMMLNHIPVHPAVIMITQFIGVFAESISEEKWAEVLAYSFPPCGEEGCDCHLAIRAFLPELHKLKVTSTEGQKRGQHADKEEEQ